MSKKMCSLSLLVKNVRTKRHINFFFWKFSCILGFCDVIIFFNDVFVSVLFTIILLFFSRLSRHPHCDSFIWQIQVCCKFSKIAILSECFFLSLRRSVCHTEKEKKKKIVIEFNFDWHKISSSLRQVNELLKLKNKKKTKWVFYIIKVPSPP